VKDTALVFKVSYFIPKYKSIIGKSMKMSSGNISQRKFHQYSIEKRRILNLAAKEIEAKACHQTETRYKLCRIAGERCTLHNHGYLKA